MQNDHIICISRLVCAKVPDTQLLHKDALAQQLQEFAQEIKTITFQALAEHHGYSDNLPFYDARTLTIKSHAFVENYRLYFNSN